MTPFNRLFSLMSKPWFVLTYLFFIVLTFMFVDKPLAEYMHTIDLRTNFALLSLITKLGLSALYLGFFLAGALFFRYVQVNPVYEARFWFLWLCVLFTESICGVLKVILGRARPDMWFETQSFGFYGLQTKASFWSFPSGHTTAVMAVAFGMSIIFPRQRYIYITAGILVALSRVLLVHHYLTDILSAIYLVVFEIGLLLCFLQKRAWLSSAFRDEKVLKMAY
ncbi:MAG: phosphatase PAP2 family protein [Legionella sp.]|nr:phosphatase PAP2 family protein [Legionella sp.]